MAKRTAIIDIGSNSARMVVFEKSSRYAFHLIKEVKSRIRIGEGAYDKEGYLQLEPMQRGFNALENFVHIIKNLKCNKTLCVATSALRDAPNAHIFIQKIRQDLGLHVRIIDGDKEAYYGALSAINFLKPFEEATTIDIGGGSTELAKIVHGNVIKTISINLGTVRLKELFFDKKASKESIKEYIYSQIQNIPNEFKSNNLIVIGGTLRALSQAIMDKKNYPLKTVHFFEYQLQEHQDFIEKIIHSDVFDLKDFSIRKDRYDTMREGCAIFYETAKFLEASHIITNGTGVREGVFLEDLLRSSNSRFPTNFYPSVRSLSDRFDLEKENSRYISKIALELFDTLHYIHQIDHKYKKELSIACKLHSIGRSLSFYQEHLHSFYFILNNLNYNFSHKEKVLIAILVKYHTKKLPSFEDMLSYDELLPDIQIVNWLSFIISLAKCLNISLAKAKLEMKYENHTLKIKSKESLYISKECIKKLIKPASFAIVIEKED
ncbi:MAG: exopolyphosphatase / guanosine-5-triphosphate,3-diphosphate pyrophosphatase [Sulfurospirillum sp.]|nr:exopolyphosphatase / guanosine-5-triphosphate,3-diphosphate pyrophosphatase [Sulfurospirillum sp.]